MADDTADYIRRTMVPVTLERRDAVVTVTIDLNNIEPSAEANNIEICVVVKPPKLQK